MIIAKTPLRVSFVGGGSDLPSYFQKRVGAVVSTTIDKFIYITVNRKFDNKIRASYSKTEMVNSVLDLKHELIREALIKVGVDKGIEITSISDIPSRGTGLGSSSTYIVGLLKALYGYCGRHVGAERLAREASEIEIDVLGKPIGKQDQYAASYGGLNFIQFNPDGNVFVEPIMCKPKTKTQLEKSFLLFYTNITRSSTTILSEQKKNIQNHKDKIRIIDKMVELAKLMAMSLNNDKTDNFGSLLHENWLLKREMASSITNSKIDEWYNTAREKGAYGGKILGAGGGGFLLLYAPIRKHNKIRESLKDLQQISFKFEPQGSRIIFVEE